MEQTAKEPTTAVPWPTNCDCEGCTQLLPCPFCGAAPVARDWGEFAYIECEECGAAPFGKARHPMAVYQWNRRARFTFDDPGDTGTCHGKNGARWRVEGGRVVEKLG